MKKRIIVLLAALIVFALALTGCGAKTGTEEEPAGVVQRTVGSDAGQGADSADKQVESIEASPPAETAEKSEKPESDKTPDSELYTLIIPPSLSVLSSETNDEYVAEWNDETTMVPGPQGEDVPIRQMYTDMFVNDDGLLTFVFTAEQLEWYKQVMRNVMSLQAVIPRDTAAGRGVMRVEYSDDKTECTLYVGGCDEYDYSDAMALAMGLYQLANGVDPDEWNAHVVVKDYETGNIISDDNYPTER